MFIKINLLLLKHQQIKSFTRFSQSFQEQSFIQNYYYFISQRSLNINTNQQQKLFLELQQNVNKIENLESIIGILDKSFKNNIQMSSQLIDSLLSQSEELVKQNRIKDIDKIKGLLLVLALNKLEKRSLYEATIQYIQINMKKLPLSHILTIAESLAYNKLLLRYEGINFYDLIEAFAETFINESDMEQNNINDIIRKINSLMVFLEKGKYQYYQERERQMMVYLIQQTQICFATILQNITFLQPKQKSMQGLFTQKSSVQIQFSDENFQQIFNIIEIQDSYDLLSKTLKVNEKNFKDFFYMYKKTTQQVTQLFSQTLKDEILQHIIFTKQKIEIINGFLKKFLITPPTYFPHPMKTMINNVYFTILQDFADNKFIRCEYNLTQILPFFIFLQKTHSPVKLDKNNIKFLDFLIISELNIHTLARLIEGIGQLFMKQGTTEKIELNKLIRNIEIKIIGSSNNTLHPSQPLLQLFQSLVQLYPYEPSLETTEYLIDFFLYGKNLQKMNWVELIIKFLPSLGIFTKNLNSKFFQDQKIDFPHTAKLQELWEKLIIQLTHRVETLQVDKIPTIIIYLSHSSFLNCMNIPKFLINLRRIIETNFTSFNGVQLSEITFAYSRLNYNENTFYINIAKHIITQNVAMSFEGAIGMLWALATSKIRIEHFIEYLEQIIIKEQKQISIDLITQYFQVNSIYARKPNIQIQSNFISQANLQYESNKLNYKNYFLVNCGLLINGQALDQEKNLFQCISDNKEQILNSPLQIHQLYILYLVNQTSDQPNLKINQLQQMISKQLLLKYSQQFKNIKKSSAETIIVEKIKNLIDNKKLKLNHLQKNDLVFYDEDKEAEVNIENYIPFQCDLRIENYCFEINGPRHYISIVDKDYQITEFQLDGPSILKKRVLEAFKLKYIEINLNKLNMIPSLRTNNQNRGSDEENKFEQELIKIIDQYQL